MLVHGHGAGVVNRHAACNRIGAPHSVVFGGFSAEELRDRINDAQAKIPRHTLMAVTAAAPSCH